MCVHVYVCLCVYTVYSFRSVLIVRLRDLEIQLAITELSTGTGPDCIALILEQSDLGLQCYDQCLQLLCVFFFFFFLCVCVFRIGMIIVNVCLL